MQVGLLHRIFQLEPLPLRMLMIQLRLELLPGSQSHSSDEDCIVLLAMLAPPVQQ